MLHLACDPFATSMRCSTSARPLLDAQVLSLQPSASFCISIEELCKFLHRFAEAVKAPYLTVSLDRSLSVVTNKEIETGAKAIAEDFGLPGGGQKKLARVVEGHLAWFDAVEARGMTWADVARLLFAAGAKGRNGRPFSVGTLSSTVWRKREDAERDAEGSASSSKPGIRSLAQPPRSGEERSDRAEPPRKRGQTRRSTFGEPERRPKKVEKKKVKASKERSLPTQSVRLLPKVSSSEDLQAFMQRSAAVRGFRSGE
jgi:hypothetical protein